MKNAYKNLKIAAFETEYISPEISFTKTKFLILLKSFEPFGFEYMYEELTQVAFYKR